MTSISRTVAVLHQCVLRWSLLAWDKLVLVAVVLLLCLLLPLLHDNCIVVVYLALPLLGLDFTSSLAA